MSETAEIRAALEAQLATVSGIPDATRRIAENSRGEIKSDGRIWLTSRLSFLPERVLTKPHNGGLKRREGFWTLLVRCPLQTGTTAADDLVQAIADAFPSGLTLTNGSTDVHCDGADRGSGGRDIDEGRYTVPVTIRWHVHTTNTVP